MSLDKIGQSAANQQPLTAEQQKNLSKLHETAQQMESLFVNMLFTEMRKTTSQESLTGKASQAEQTFQSMLDEKYSEDLAKTGSLGLGKMIEQQLRSAVLGTPPNAESNPARSAIVPPQAAPPKEERK